MKINRKHTEGYLATTALIGFIVSFGYNGTISYKTFVKGVVLTTVIFGSGIAWSIIEERRKFYWITSALIITFHLMKGKK